VSIVADAVVGRDARRVTSVTGSPDDLVDGVGPDVASGTVHVVRDDDADHRDAAAAERDAAAADRDASAETRAVGKTGRRLARSDRMSSAGDRLAAEQDRLFSALDRDFADFDRRESARERIALTTDLPDGGDHNDGWLEAGRRRDLAASLRDEAARRRDDLSSQRTEISAARDLDADLRDRSADLIDAMADLRDRTALERDRAAAARDVAAVHRDMLALERERRARDLQAHGAEPSLGLLVTEAETDHQLATVDRLHSAMDRVAALHDRHSSAAAPSASGFDPETGVLTAGEGLYALESRWGDVTEGHDRMSAALVDLAEPLAEKGAELVALVDRIRASLSHRDLVLRWSVTGFLVVLTDTDTPRSVDQVLDELGVAPVVFVEREPGATLQGFLELVVEKAVPVPYV
jgi:hypothetical protein